MVTAGNVRDNIKLKRLIFERKLSQFKQLIYNGEFDPGSG